METDRTFTEIFEHRPDWLALITGEPFPAAKAAYPKVFKPKVECDLVVEPIDPTAPHRIIEFQFYLDASVFVRAEMARLAEWRRLNPASKCRLRGYVPRRVEAFVVFGERSHFPAGAEAEFPRIGFVFLGERLTELARENPSNPLLSLLRPIVEPSAQEVETHAAADFHGLSGHPELEEADQLYFSKMYLHLLMQRFATKDSEEIRQMIAELIPVEETRCGRELIEKGIEKGIEQGIEQAVQGLHRQGVAVEVIARALSLSEDAVLRIIAR
jgi:hypothetical protein